MNGESLILPTTLYSLTIKTLEEFKFAMQITFEITKVQQNQIWQGQDGAQSLVILARSPGVAIFDWVVL